MIVLSEILLIFVHTSLGPILIGTRDTGKPCGLDETEIVNPTEKRLNQGLNKI